ncbi:MAG: NAD(P)-dependent oxidoreductase [Lachnospiraceae bacterium]|nr:NAD(P)-dependent oxidoreductase [Lachnospiraceae bacterium]
MVALVGYTGFVGSNIYAGGQIDKAFNSKNIEEAFGLEPDLLIYSGLRAEKYLANNAPEKDMELIEQAKENIRRIAPKRLVLISTVDVWKTPVDVNEDDAIDCEGLHAYGLNRYRLECWVRENYPDALIIRLPGLFGINIKKNFIYDYIHVIPFMLKETKFQELAAREPLLNQCYELQDNGFYKCKELSCKMRDVLKERFRQLSFTALNFTDSRNVYQFYPLERLWDDIRLALENDIRLWHPATEPVSAAQVYEFLTGEDFVNELGGTPVVYDYRTKYDKLFGGSNGYICDKEQILQKIAAFINQEEGRCQA